MNEYWCLSEVGTIRIQIGVIEILAGGLIPYGYNILRVAYHSKAGVN